jgi:hypothetical protein
MSYKMLLRTLENLSEYTQKHLRPSFCLHNPTTDHTPVERTHVRLPPGRIQVSLSHIFNAKARGDALTEFVGATQTRIRPDRVPGEMVMAEECIHKECYPYLRPPHKCGARQGRSIASWSAGCNPKITDRIGWRGERARCMYDGDDIV